MSASINRRQFILSKTKFNEEGFLHLLLENGMQLSYHHELKIKRNEGKVLIGHAFHTAMRGDVILDENASLNMKKWGGDGY